MSSLRQVYRKDSSFIIIIYIYIGIFIIKYYLTDITSINIDSTHRFGFLEGVFFLSLYHENITASFY